MPNKCNEESSSIISFLGEYDRITIISFTIFSFILNLMICISIFLSRNKNVSIIIRLTLSILITNFIHVLSYIFQWVTCKTEITNKNDIIEKYETNLLFNYSFCEVQAFMILVSSLSQDYLIIIFFFMVNNKEIINIKYINFFNLLGILFPIILSVVFLLNNALGINDDFCYIKKLDNFYVEEKSNIYIFFDDYDIYAIIVYSLRGTSLLVSLFLFVKIVIYIRKEKSHNYFKKLSILIIQLFKLFVIIIYRIPSLFLAEYPDFLQKLYNILSTVDGVLMPLAFILSNDIMNHYYNSQLRRIETERIFGDKDFKDEKGRTFRMSLEPDEKDKEGDREAILPGQSVQQSNIPFNPLTSNSNNFDFSFDG